jgi:hypothetical protein
MVVQEVDSNTSRARASRMFGNYTAGAPNREVHAFFHFADLQRF